MQGDIVLWVLALVRAATIAAGLVLVIFLTQELLSPGSESNMRAPAVFYNVQSWLEELWSNLTPQPKPTPWQEANANAKNWSEEVWLRLNHPKPLAEGWLVALGRAAAVGVILYVLRLIHTTCLRPYWVYRSLKQQGMKGVMFRPFIGQIPEMRQYIKCKKVDPDFAALLFPQAAEAEAKYGQVYVSQMGSSIRVVLTDPAAMKEVLVTKARCFEKTAFARRMLSVLGNGLVFSEGALWERQRKLINPAFTHTKIKAMSDIMLRCANEAAERWCAKIQGGAQELEMQREFSRLTLDVVGRAAFGSGDAASEAVADEMYTGLNKLLEEKIGKIMSGMEFIPGYGSLPTPANRSIQRRERRLREMGLRLIQQRREDREKGVEKEDLLGLMLAAQDEHTDKGMTDNQLLDECMTFLLAGHDTTAVLLTWTVYLLTKHPDYCDQARKEVSEVLAGREELPFDDLHKLRLLQCILYESLRLFPPIPIMGREAIEPVEIAGYKLPKGCGISMMSYPMQTRAALWGEDAKEFRPERFVNGISGAVKHPTAFLPFSAGPRNCIGQNFALTEAKIVLVKLLRRFSLKLAPGYRHSPVMFITLKPGHGLPIILERLEETAHASSGPDHRAIESCSVQTVKYR